jgi:hypothetical protein
MNPRWFVGHVFDFFIVSRFDGFGKLWDEYNSQKKRGSLLTSVVSTLLGLLILIYGYTSLAFFYFRIQEDGASYQFQDGAQLRYCEGDRMDERGMCDDTATGKSLCDSMLSCLAYHLDYGLREPPMWRYSAESFPTDLDLAGHWAFNISYYFLVTVMPVSILTGFFIDTLSQSTKRSKELQEAVAGRCFICNGTRDEIMKTGVNFEAHRQGHAVKSYIYYLYYLEKKHDDEFTCIEKEINDKMKCRPYDVSFLPVFTAAVGEGAAGGEAFASGAAVVSAADRDRAIVSGQTETALESMKAVVEEQKGALARQTMETVSLIETKVEQAMGQVEEQLKTHVDRLEQRVDRKMGKMDVKLEAILQLLSTKAAS